MKKVLPLSFFQREGLTVAQELLGKYLVAHVDGKIVAHQITDVELYDGPDDKASHAHRGKTERNKVMFAQGGLWYPYFVYGMHWLLNIVVGGEGYPAAILIRAVEGIDGPARVARAFGVSKKVYGLPATRASGLWIEDRGTNATPSRITRGPRIGVPYAGDWADKPYRLTIQWLTRDKYGGDPTHSLLTRDLARVKKGEPLEYVIGWKEFCGVRVDLSQKPLIPREETEYWVEKILPQIKKLKNPQVLDLCSGSGAIGLAVLAGHPRARVTFTDVSDRALKQIKINLDLNPSLKKRATIIKTNLFKNIPGKFDFILSNPPYIPSARIKRLPKSVRNFEPRLALDGGVDGMRTVRCVIKDAPSYLKQKGLFALELDSAHAKKAKEFARQYFKHIELHTDQYGRPRVLLLR